MFISVSLNDSNVSHRN